MFKNYIKIAFRNLWKNKGYNIINILGMALGFTAFLLILFYINYENSYDKIFPDHQDVVLAGIEAPGQKQNGTTMSAGFGPLATQEFPEIKNYTRVNFFKSKGLWMVGDKSNYVSNMYRVDSTFFNVFQYAFLYGDREHALDKPNSIVISDVVCRQFFGDDNPVGRRITFNRSKDYTVTGVFKTLDGPTTFHPDAFEKLDVYGRESRLFPMNYYTFFQLRKDADVPVLEQKLSGFLRAWAKKVVPASDFTTSKVLLNPITDMHFSDVPGATEVGDKASLTMLLTIGIILLLIASVNFINLSVASSMGRAKEVGMRKVMGAGQSSLRIQFYLEIFLQILLAFFLANVIAELLKPAYANFLGLISLTNYAGELNMVLYSSAVLLCITLLAGGYPAFYLAHFNPSRVLKGSFSKGKSGNLTQRVLLVCQLTLTTIFLVGVMIMAKQIRFLRNINLGFQPDQVMTIPLHTDKADQQFESLKAALNQVPGVTEVSRVDNLPGGALMANNYKYKDREEAIAYLSVGYDFAKTMGMAVLSGRDFNPQQDPDTLGHIILNQMAVKKLGITGDPVGQYVECNPGGQKDQVIGVVSDFHYGTLENHIYPIIFQLHQGNWMRNVLIRMQTRDLAHTLSGIKSAWKKFEPGFPVTHTFLDDYFSRSMRSFERQEKMVFTFALLAILLSLFGLFALVAFSIRRRTKEMAVRKVLGASNNAILRLLNRNFIWVAIVGNILGWPLAYLAANQWLKGFAYRIAMPAWPFVLAAILCVLLTATTVSVLAWKAARANPVDALKYE